MRSTLSSLMVMAVTAACSDDAAPPLRSIADPLPEVTSESAQQWTLTFEDEFDGDAVDGSKWTARDGELKHENSALLNTAAKELVTVRDGSLFVAADRAPSGASRPFRAGRLETKGRFAQTYGKVEVQVRATFAPGLWYAIWGRPWVNAVPEIDIEFLGKNINQAWFVNHWALPPLPANERRAFVTVDGLDIRQSHTYGVIWTPDIVEWSIDGKPYMRAEGRGVPHEPAYWVVNTWVGGWGGAPSASTAFPAHFEVESFRVWRTAEWLVPPSIRAASARKTYSVDGTDMIELEVADVDRGTTRVEAIIDGDRRLSLESGPPYTLSPRALGKGHFFVTFVVTDGERRASTDAEIFVE